MQMLDFVSLPLFPAVLIPRGGALTGRGVHPDSYELWGRHGRDRELCNDMAGRSYLLDPIWVRIGSQRKEGSLIPI